MRIITQTRKKKPTGKIFKIYDNLEESVKDGVNESEVVKNWRILENNVVLAERVKNGNCWVVSDDDVIPDYYDRERKEIIPVYDRNGGVIPTTGCIVQVIEYVEKDSHHPFSVNYFRIPTGTFLFKAKRLTTERRPSPWSFVPYVSFLGSSYNITKKKRMAVLALLNPLSPTYGRMGVSFLSVYPHYKRHKSFVVREIALKFYNRPWFYRLIKENRLMSMLIQDAKLELEKKGINAKYIVEKLDLAMQYAEQRKDPRSIIAVLTEIRGILDKDTGEDIHHPELPSHEGAPLLVPHVDVTKGLSPGEYMTPEQYSERKQLYDVSDAIILPEEEEVEEIEKLAEEAKQV